MYQCHHSPTPTIQILRKQICRFSASLCLFLSVSRLSLQNLQTSGLLLPLYDSLPDGILKLNNPPPPPPPPLFCLPLFLSQCNNKKYRHSPTLTIIRIMRKTVLVLQREARSKDLLCACVETQSTQKLQCVLACFASCSLLHTTQEESLSFLYLCVRVLLLRGNSMGLFYTLHPFPFFPPSLSFPPPSFTLHHLLVLAFLNNN